MDKKSWESALQKIFSEIFLDQLHKEFKDVESEVNQVYHYLNSNEKPEHLREVDNAEEFKAFLHIPDWKAFCILQECGGDVNQAHLEMARVFVTRAYQAIAGARTFEGGAHMTSLQVWNENRQLENKEVPAGFVRSQLSPKQRGFAQEYTPPAFCQRTESFDNLKAHIVSRQYKVCHVYGMSGAGKSKTILSVCSELDKEEQQYAIWHVQCPQKKDVLKESLNKFTSRLRKCYPEYHIENIAQDRKSRHFVRSLANMPFNVLLAFEDSENEQDKELVRDLVGNMFINNVKNIQLILATQLSDAFYPGGEPPSGSNDYKMFQVTGFTEYEALNFLCGVDSPDDSAKLLASELAYSPFRLYIAKQFCKKYNLSYRSYYDNLGKNEYIINAEKQLLEKFPNLGKHTYEVVAKMLEPENEDEKYQQDVLKMLSFLDSICVPGALIGKFYRETSPNVCDASSESLHVQILLTRLQDEFSVSWYSINEQYVMISMIHRDILTAIRFGMSIDERRDVIIKVLRSIASLIGKDNRIRKNNTLLSDMKNHLSLVFQFAEELLGSNLEMINSPTHTQKLDILIYLTHLCSVVGFTTSQFSSSTDDSWFDKATKYLLKATYALKNDPYEVELADNEIESCLAFAEEKDPEETAAKLYDILYGVSVNISGNWIHEINNRMHPITMAYIRDMKMRWPDLQWDDIEDCVKSSKPLNEQQLLRLQQAGALINSVDFRYIFLAEYLSSILYSRGRQMFYLKETLKSEDRKQFEWFTDVGFFLCKVIHEKNGIKSIFGYIIEANNILHRLLVPNSSKESDSEFVDRLQKARTLAKQVLNVQGDFYEHGRYKQVSGGPFTVLNALNIIVKANTKIYKRQHLVQTFINGEEDNQCSQLCYVAKQFAEKFSFASNCLINVARYLGATGKYDMAMESIENGFNTDNFGINSQRDIKVETCVWALYNSGRVLYASQMNMENFTNHCDRFFARYKSLKHHKGSEIPTNWHEKIDDMKSRLELLQEKMKKQN